jgi:autoinducer-2 kinase
MGDRSSMPSIPISPLVPADGILVIDAGTSALRAVLVCDGEARALAVEPWRLFRPRDGSAFARELDAVEVAAALERLLAVAGRERERVAGIAVTGQREGAVFLDDAGGALLVSPNVDGRAAMEGMAIDARYGDRVYAVTGHLPALLQAPAKLAWLRANRPNVAERVHRVLPLADWLASLLTGELAMSRSLASEIGLLDISTGEVAATLLETLEMPPPLLPLVVPDGAMAGAMRMGAMVGVPVALSGADTQCALAGMAIADDRAVGVAAGWSVPVQMVAAAPLMDAERRIWTGLHVLPGTWVLESNAGDCGRAWDWICSMLSLDTVQADDLAAEAQPGSRDVLALLGPPAMRASTMNVTTGGLTLPMPLAVSAPQRGDLARAVREATAYAVRANLEQLEEISGVRAHRIALGGGILNSAVFARILADVLGRPVDLARSPETSALGAAAIASPAFGLHDTIAEAIAVVTAGMETREPDMRTSATYDDCYARWRGMAEQMESGAI